MTCFTRQLTNVVIHLQFTLKRLSYREAKTPKAVERIIIIKATSEF